ncbi:hypothetical protein LJR118_000581 [Acidovorax sp. LjRoot118]|uniref:hypothetical protein n=1 Tax=Acidovorax sp. LjRoot118 TaxID=3342256 RepID=UPI003ECCFB90
MHSATITIHLIDQPAGGVMVLTTAGSPQPGRGLTPAQALATDLLTQCTHRASDVRYWQGEDKALAFVESCLQPEGLGFSVNSHARDMARMVLGMPCVEALKPTPPSEVPA